MTAHGRTWGSVPGKIQASLVISCAIGEERELIEGSSYIKAGALARAKGWEFRQKLGWVCEPCALVLDAALDRQRRIVEKERREAVLRGVAEREAAKETKRAELAAWRAARVAELMEQAR